MINNKIGGRNMVGRAVNRLAGRLTAVALTAAMAGVVVAGGGGGGKNNGTGGKKGDKPFAMEQVEGEKDTKGI